MTTRARSQCRRKLEPYQILQIRDLYKWGYNRLALSLMFNIGKGPIERIISYSTYKDIA